MQVDQTLFLEKDNLIILSRIDRKDYIKMTDITQKITSSEEQLGFDFDSLSVAEAFYKLFQALPLNERLTIAHYIFVDEAVQQGLDLVITSNQKDVPNRLTLQTFTEDKQTMPIFETLEALQQDILT